MGEMSEDFAFMKEQRQKHKDAVTPDRMAFAAKLLEENNCTYEQREPGQLMVNGYITLWVYTGWWSGRGIGSGRGIKNLIFKLNNKNY